MTALRIANCSGFWGDRATAAVEMVRGGPIDVLTGDYLSELTMALLAKQRAGGKGGFVGSFVAHVEPVLAECAARGIKIVTNAGGLDPHGLAQTLRELGARLGVPLRIAVVSGDDILPRLSELQAAGERFVHLDRGQPIDCGGVDVVTANAYLGGWGIAEALLRGADIVVTGRVTDAALVVGPAAWRFGWARDDWDRLAGAVAAGHIIECSAQATGGNYSFFREVDWSKPLGFPIAEMSADGSFVITKHPNTGGRVSVGTVTAQLLYEIDGPRYFNPDVVARFDSVQLEEVGMDEVRGSGTRGEPPPPTAKVTINYVGGYRNSMTVRLAGLDVPEKAALVTQLARAAVGDCEARLMRGDHVDPADNDAAMALLTLTAKSPDKTRVGKAWAGKLVELALSSVPGHSITQPPGDATPYLVYWPALVDASQLQPLVTLDGADGAAAEDSYAIVAPPTAAERAPIVPSKPTWDARLDGPTVRVPLGHVFGSRSGDKGGNANLGLWSKTTLAYTWLEHYLTVDEMRQLFSDLAPHPMTRTLLPNLNAIHFYIHGLLGEGVASSTRSDPQAKTLGEYVRARVVAMPVVLLS
jgi:hypothetical protein